MTADFLTTSFAELGALAPDPTDMYIALRLRVSGAAPTPRTLRDRVAERLPLLPELTERLVTGPRPRWEPDPEFDLDRHVRQVRVGQEGARTHDGTPGRGQNPVVAEVRGSVGIPVHALLGESPDPLRPPWQLLIESDPAADRWTLFYLAHHARQDVTGARHTVTRLLGDATPLPLDDPPLHRHRWLGGLAAVMPDLRRSERRSAPARKFPTGPGRLLGEVTVGSSLLTATAAATGATVNQVHLAALSVALRRWSPDWERADSREIAIPLDTRLLGEVAYAANRIGLMRVLLPGYEPDPRARLEDLRLAASRARIARHRRATRKLSAGPRRVAAWAQGRVTDPAVIGVTASNVRIDQGITVLGAPVLECAALPWLPPGHECFSLLTTYNGSATLAAVAPSDCPDPADLVDAWAGALRELSSQA